MVDCAGHYENDLAVSVFFNVHIVSKSPAEISPPIADILELRARANFHCLVNQALSVIFLVCLQSN